SEVLRIGLLLLVAGRDRVNFVLSMWEAASGFESGDRRFGMAPAIGDLLGSEPGGCPKLRLRRQLENRRQICGVRELKPGRHYAEQSVGVAIKLNGLAAHFRIAAKAFLP